MTRPLTKYVLQVSSCARFSSLDLLFRLPPIPSLSCVSGPFVPRLAAQQWRLNSPFFCGGEPSSSHGFCQALEQNDDSAFAARNSVFTQTFREFSWNVVVASTASLWRDASLAPFLGGREAFRSSLQSNQRAKSLEGLGRHSLQIYHKFSIKRYKNPFEASRPSLSPSVFGRMYLTSIYVVCINGGAGAGKRRGIRV